MRILIYSDIHANWEAMQAVAAATEGQFDTAICLGDVVGYGADPNLATTWVREHSAVTVRGNHDRACASFDGIEGFNPIAAQAARWTHEQLTPDHLAWLDDLPAGPLPWQNSMLVHGSPLDEDEYLIEPVQAAAAFSVGDTTLVWYGHSHVQGGFALADDQVFSLRSAAEDHPGPKAPPNQVEFPLRPGARYLINPGSVGQPRDGDWRAACALYDTDHNTVTFYRFPYDIEQAQTKILTAGLPPRLAQRLAAGK